MAEDFPCQFCNVLFKDAEERQLHQVSTCQAVDDAGDILAIELANALTDDPVIPPADEEEPQSVNVNTQEVVDRMRGVSDETAPLADTAEAPDELAVEVTSFEQNDTLGESKIPDEKISNELQPSNEDILYAAEVKKIIAEFCVGAPCKEVRDILRLYSLEKTYKKQTTSFNAHSKADIIKTLQYLGESQRDWNVERKSVCVHELVYRIQNLLPEECGLCKQTYVVKISGPHLLSCSICHQEVHHECYQSLFRTDNEGTMLVKKLMDLPGFHYMCMSCEEDTIPDGRVRRSQSESKLTTGDSNNTVHVCGAAGGDEPTHVKVIQQEEEKLETSNNDNLVPSISHTKVKKKTPLNPEVVVEIPSTAKGAAEDPEKIDKSTHVCKHYKNNQCKFGISGKDCPFLHPKRCSKLMNHGTRSDRGCNLGAKCKDFHPKMCPMSISKSECYDQSCSLCHVKGTKRKRMPLKSEAAKTAPRTDAATAQPMSSSTKVTTQQSFLDQMNLLRKELQEVMDQKLAALIPAKAQQSHQQIPSPVSLSQTQHQAPFLPIQFPLPAPIPWMHQFYQMQRYPQIPMMGY